jgi:hypothetical protein
MGSITEKSAGLDPPWLMSAVCKCKTLKCAAHKHDIVYTNESISGNYSVLLDES